MQRHKQRRNPKLALNGETLRGLTTSQIALAQGGRLALDAGSESAETCPISGDAICVSGLSGSAGCLVCARVRRGVRMW